MVNYAFLLIIHWEQLSDSYCCVVESSLQHHASTMDLTRWMIWIKPKLHWILVQVSESDSSTRCLIWQVLENRIHGHNYSQIHLIKFTFIKHNNMQITQDTNVTLNNISILYWDIKRKKYNNSIIKKLVIFFTTTKHCLN